jgi:hypothetical protein
MKAVDISPDNPKEFYIIIKKKCYRLLCEHEGEAQKWVNSLKAVREGGFGLGQEHLDQNRYEKLKVYSRVTGKSMYKEYDVLLEGYEEAIHESIEAKLMDHLSKRKKLGTLQSALNKNVKKEIKSRKASLLGRGKDSKNSAAAMLEA